MHIEADRQSRKAVVEAENEKELLQTAGQKYLLHKSFNFFNIFKKY